MSGLGRRLVSPVGSELKAALSDCVWGHPHEFYALITSTNQRAKAWAQEGASEGALVVADDQSAGRGRFGRTWVAPAGTALLFSLVLRPQIEPPKAPLVALLAAAAVRQTVADQAGVAATIKWPNDVLAEGKKLAGVLAESLLEGNRLSAVIAGVGVNVNQETFATERATSLYGLSGRAHERFRLLAAILEGMHQRYQALSRGDTVALLAECRTHSATIGREVVLHGGGGQVTGRAVDIDSDGRLVLETQDGLVRAAAGEVTTGEDVL